MWGRRHEDGPEAGHIYLQVRSEGGPEMLSGVACSAHWQSEPVAVHLWGGKTWGLVEARRGRGVSLRVAV